MAANKSSFGAENGNKPGAPIGNQNPADALKYRAALERALREKSKKDGLDALNAIAEGVINQAIKGEQWANLMIADRLDGKPHQTVSAEVDTTVNILVKRFGPPASK